MNQCPRFSPDLRQESIQLALDPELYVVAEEFLAGAPSPKELSSEARTKLGDQLKPIRFGLVSQAIRQILETELSDEEISEAELRQELYHPSAMNDPIQKVRLYMLRRYIGQCQKFFEINGNKPLMATLSRVNDLQCQIEDNHWSNIEMSLAAGAGTATETVYNLLAGYLKFLGTLNLSVKDKEAKLRKSYGALIEIAHLDAYQLIAAMSSLEDGSVGFSLSPSGNNLRFSKPVSEWELSESAREDAKRIAGHIELGDDIVNIEQMSNKEVILGCPILYPADQLKILWNDVIDKAIEYDAVT